MNARYHALTEKEKQTLRLLVSGYDAKSMARHLGLSVHTVNERLRDARRKMATSSSREAARMLHELEAQTPELLGDNSLGDAQALDPVEQSQASQGKAGTSRRPLLIIGGLAMSLALALYALTALTGGGETAAGPGPDTAVAVQEQAVITATRDWLALVDAADWAGSWKATGHQFRELNTLEVWTRASEQVRTPLGAVISREVMTVDFAPAPPAGYWVIKFRTSFANKAGATEKLSLVWEGGNWRVVGYTIE